MAGQRRSTKTRTLPSARCRALSHVKHCAAQEPVQGFERARRKSPEVRAAAAQHGTRDGSRRAQCRTQLKMQRSVMMQRRRCVTRTNALRTARTSRGGLLAAVDGSHHGSKCVPLLCSTPICTSGLWHALRMLHAPCLVHCSTLRPKGAPQPMGPQCFGQALRVQARVLRCDAWRACTVGAFDTKCNSQCATGECVVGSRYSHVPRCTLLSAVHA